MGGPGEVTDDGIEHLRRHKLSTCEYTPLDHLMDPLWQAIAELVPRRISPNMISCVGGAFACVSTLVAVVASQTRSATLQIVAGALLIGYQTADAVDGKHARLTGQATPLGGLVDHGIDAFVAFTTGVAVCISVNPDLTSVTTMIAFCVFHTAWFCSNWCALETGALDTRGITEGELAAALAIALPGLFGLDVYGTFLAVPVLGTTEARRLLEYAIIFGCGAISVMHSIKVILVTRKFGSYVPLLQWLFHCALAVLIFTSAGREAPLLVYGVAGMDACQLMTKLPLALSMNSPWPRMHVEMMPFCAFALACGLGVTLGKVVLSVIFAWQVFVFARLWYCSIKRICAGLGIPFLAEVPHKSD